MRVAVLGTGTVGRALAGACGSLGHDVRIGTRDVAALMARTETTQTGDPPFATWHAEHRTVTPDTFAVAAAHGEVVFNATSGDASLDALDAAGAANLAGKVVIDVANPLDFSNGFPPTLSVANTDSLGEQIQRRFPEAKVVKTLNTVTASLMVRPSAVGDGEHQMFVAGDDADAKRTATEILTEWFGWRHVLDLGGIEQARGLEMYVSLWVRLYGTIGTPLFNVALVTETGRTTG